MHGTDSAFSPFEAWSSAVMAATTATLELTTSTASVWSNAFTVGVAPAVEAIQPKAATARFERYSAPSTTFEVPRASASSSGRSWYKAPYRSPFDPLFWMMPGHPVDHMDVWLGPMRAAAAAMPVPGFPSIMATNAFAPPPPVQVPAAWQSPWTAWTDMLSAMSDRSAHPVKLPGFAPLMATNAFAPPVQEPAAWQSPWTGWTDILSAMSGQPAQPAKSVNVIDFPSAYAAFRTAGGHAAAQIVRMPSPQPPQTADASAVPAAWLSILRLYGWPGV